MPVTAVPIVKILIVFIVNAFYFGNGIIFIQITYNALFSVLQACFFSLFMLTLYLAFGLLN
jgi:hypothetical protein